MPDLDRLESCVRTNPLRQLQERLRGTRPVPAVVSRFHRHYYETGERRGTTWKDTWWMGSPLWKCPLDLWVYQEMLHELRPQLVIETGTYAGGSALFFAHMLDLIGDGRVVTVDITAPTEFERPAHPRITYLTGSSVDPVIVDQVAAAAAACASVMVVLDSDHSYDHVRRELAAYAPLVTAGSYLVVEDTNVNGNPVLKSFGPGPMEAVDEFVARTSDFQIDREREKFMLTFNPRGFLRRTRATIGG